MRNRKRKRGRRRGRKTGHNEVRREASVPWLELLSNWHLLPTPC
jgi:hypothetical protein